MLSGLLEQTKNGQGVCGGVCACVDFALREMVARLTEPSALPQDAGLESPKRLVLKLYNEEAALLSEP